MVRKAIISTLATALVLTGSVLGLAGGASAAAPAPAGVARTSSPTVTADDVPLQDRVQQLADSLAEGLKLHGRKNLRKNNRLWQHGPAPAPGGTAHIVIRLKSGAVLGANDVTFTEAGGGSHQFYLALPRARKLLKHRKHPVLVAEVTFSSASGQVLAASQRTKL